MTVTIRDVAKHLNLSITTVSRALDGYPDVADETRTRIIHAARDLGYSPNQAARQLRRQRSDAIGFILPVQQIRFSDPFISEFIEGLADSIVLPGYDLLVAAAPAGIDAEKRLYQRWVEAHKVDGFILNRLQRYDWRVRYLAQQQIPFTALERSLDEVEYPSIETNTHANMIALVTHVFQRGFRRLAYIGGPEDLMIDVLRYNGYQCGLKTHGLVEKAGFVERANLTSSGGYDAGMRLLKKKTPPDAILCVNDETAFGVLHAARDVGRVVGVDLAVTGFDGVQDSLHTQPPLTTLDQPVYDIARQLAEMLMAMINSMNFLRRVVIQPQLRIRESTTGLNPDQRFIDAI